MLTEAKTYEHFSHKGSYSSIHSSHCAIQLDTVGRKKARGLTLNSKEPESYFTTGGLCAHHFFTSEVLFFEG